MSVSVVDPTFAHLESLTRPAPCKEELSQINESLRRREALLVASAKASRMLLEAPDVRGTIPEVLRLIGDAAHVDRVNVMLARRGPEGEPLLVVVSEWTAEGVPPHIEAALFEPLVSGRANGSGLGLALAREIARQHGGDLHHQRRNGATCFVLVLPRHSGAAR